MKKIFEDAGFADYVFWQHTDRKKVDKINRLLSSIERNGAMGGEGNPEKLKYRTDAYSRHIDSENRLVYKYTDEAITILSCRGHYI